MDTHDAKNHTKCIRSPRSLIGPAHCLTGREFCYQRVRLIGSFADNFITFRAKETSHPVAQCSTVYDFELN